LFGERLDIHPAVLAQEVDDLAVPFVSEHERMREKRARTIKDKTFCTGYRLADSRAFSSAWTLASQPPSDGRS
jgi:hypothetical protein